MHKMLLWSILALALPFTSPYPDTVPWNNNLDYPQKHSPVNVSYLNNDNIDLNGRVFIKNGHFWTKQGRLNFFGTNLTFNACFPDKELAEKVATQLAALGVNIVRLHHMDNRDIWGQYVKDFSKLDAEQLNKLDYLIFCLKQKGIYVDLNLHVSWQYTSDKTDPLYNLVRNENAFKYAKGLDTFLPELINKQKMYASMILNHKNSYTGFAYKDDPVTAMVEINNENSFYRNMIIQDGIDLIPEKYHQVLDSGFQKFLFRKYHDFNGLHKAWSVVDNNSKLTAIPEVLPMDFHNNWKVQISDPEKGTITFKDGATAVHLNYLAKNHFFQFYRTGLSFKKGQDYTLVIEVTGKSGATFGVNSMRQEAPYESAGLNKQIRLKSDGRQSFVIPFTSSEDLDHLGRITLFGFDHCTDFVIQAVCIYQGKYLLDPLKNLTDFRSVGIPALYNFQAYPAVFQTDLVAFFRQTELDYWSEMIRYLKKEVGLKVPITGTQIDYSFPELAEIYDYVDIHSYWQHPTFPGKPWDQKDYYVRNLSMVASTKTNFDKIGMFRMKGKPFTISEYNHPFPNLHTTETPTMLAVVSKLQDYDGVFSFNYLNNQDIDPASYFSHYTKFACKAVYPVSAVIFRDPSITALPEEVLWPLGENETFNNLKGLKSLTNSYFGEFAARPEEIFDLFKTKRIALQLIPEGKTDFSGFKFTGTGIATDFHWENSAADYKQNYFKYDNKKAKVYIGWNIHDQYDFQDVTLNGVEGQDRYFQFTIVNLNGPIGREGHYILTLTGREFYTNMDYFDYDTKTKLDPSQDSYGVKLMAIPTSKQNVELLENFNASISIRLLKPYKAIKISTINDLGEPVKNIPFTVKDKELIFPLKTQDNTVIYSIEIGD